MEALSKGSAAKAAARPEWWLNAAAPATVSCAAKRVYRSQGVLVANQRIECFRPSLGFRDPEAMARQPASRSNAQGLNPKSITACGMQEQVIAREKKANVSQRAAEEQAERPAWCKETRRSEYGKGI